MDRAAEGLHHLFAVAPDFRVEAGFSRVEDADYLPFAAGKKQFLAQPHARETVSDAAAHDDFVAVGLEGPSRDELDLRSERKAGGIGAAHGDVGRTVAAFLVERDQYQAFAGKQRVAGI